MSPIRPLVPATPRTVVTRDIPAEYLALGSVSAGVRGAETTSDTAWHLTFSRTGITSDVPFTFEFRYEPPGLPVQSIAADGMLIPEARFIARSLATGTLGSAMCAFDVNGAAYCWGQNHHGRLGDLTTQDRLVPTRLKTGLDLVTLTVGDTHTCGTTQDGTAKCWGSDESIGDSARAYDYGYRLSSGTVERGLTYTNLVASRNSTCGLRGGAVVCWGPIVDRFDTTGMTTLPHWGVPLGLPGSESFVSLDLGNSFGCGLTSTGAAWCFGWNYNGQLGNGTRDDRGYAAPVAGARSYTQLSAGDTHVCALDAAGQAWCWGRNADGQIGDDYASAGTGWTLTPAAVSGGLTFAQIESGAWHSCGLTAAGKAYCWGGQSYWVIGDGSGHNRGVPAPVATTLSFSELSAGNDFTCGISKGDGGVYCWGMNNFGELGIGRTSSNEPVSAVAAPE